MNNKKAKRRRKNEGQAPKYYAEDTHPAIIDKEMWDLARREEKRRNDINERTVGAGKYTNKYALSGLLVCGHCGHSLRRQIRTMGSGKRVPSWGCTLRVDKGRQYCVDSRNVNEDVLLDAYLRALNKVAGSMEEYMKIIRQNCTMVLAPKKKRELADVEQAIIDIQEEVLELHRQKKEGLVSPGVYNKKLNEYKERIDELEGKQQKLYDQQGNVLAVEYWLNQFQDATERRDEAAAEGTVIKTLVEKIVVNNQRKIVDIYFKCGVVITETI